MICLIRVALQNVNILFIFASLFRAKYAYCFYYQRWIAWCLLTSFQNFLVLFPNTALHIYTDVERFSTVQHFDAFSFQIVFKRQ